jgi:hypothetical protein
MVAFISLFTNVELMPKDVLFYITSGKHLHLHYVCFNYIIYYFNFLFHNCVMCLQLLLAQVELEFSFQHNLWTSCFGIEFFLKT